MFRFRRARSRRLRLRLVLERLLRRRRKEPFLGEQAVQGLGLEDRVGVEEGDLVLRVLLVLVDAVELAQDVVGGHRRQVALLRLALGGLISGRGARGRGRRARGGRTRARRPGWRPSGSPLDRGRGEDVAAARPRRRGRGGGVRVRDDDGGFPPRRAGARSGSTADAALSRPGTRRRVPRERRGESSAARSENRRARAGGSRGASARRGRRRRDGRRVDEIGERRPPRDANAEARWVRGRTPARARGGGERARPDGHGAGA